ncbi:transposase [Polaromonas sp.]|uniref:transposase n=1 Tax=Polaromonas sp. TaxID=1869339 RepID=UPI00185627AD|nr:transposase [Polaromonas sp.]NMM05800.1 transposase [Polaromonas sp.]
MARPLRIEFPGGLYHVTSRGDRREAIFLCDADRNYWLDLLGQVCARHNWLCHAYCLMDNHFHMVVETIDGNLSAGMRQLNGVYTQWHNRSHNRVGHVFQGRFKAIIVQREAYLLELARYVVLNPVRAGICVLPEDWPWSSYHAMLGRVVPPRWLQVQWLMSQFGNNPQAAVAAYVDHVRAGVNLPSLWEQLQGQLYLGDAEFVEVMGEKIATRLSSDAEIPRLQRRASAPPLARFAAMPARNPAIVQAYATGCYSMKEIARAFNIHYATVSRVLKNEPEKV